MKDEKNKKNNNSKVPLPGNNSDEELYFLKDNSEINKENFKTAFTRQSFDTMKTSLNFTKRITYCLTETRKSCMLKGLIGVVFAEFIGFVAVWICCVFCPILFACDCCIFPNALLFSIF